MITYTKEAERLIGKYPQFFPDGEVIDISIPIGWINYTERAFAAFIESGLQLSISSIVVFEGALYVSGTKPGKKGMFEYAGKHLMNTLLRGTRQVCAFCGVATTPPERGSVGNRHENSEDALLPICSACLQKFGLTPPGDAIPEEGKDLSGGG